MKTLTRYLLNHPWQIMVLLALVTVLLANSLRTHSRMETDLDEYMPQDHPAFIYSNQAEEWFAIKDGIIIAIENDSGVYTSKTLQKVKDLTAALQDMEEIEADDVTSLYTADNIVGTEEGLDVTPFFEEVPQTEAELTNLKQAVRANDMVFERLVSKDETVTVVIADIADDVFSQEFYQRILNLAKQYEGPEMIHIAGRPIVEGTMAYLGPRDMKRMVPIVIGVIILVLWMVTRSAKGTFLTVMVVLLSTVWTFGLMAVFRIPVYSVSTMIPVMLIAIGVADGIHLFSHLELFLVKNPGADLSAAISDMLRSMWKPVIITSVTTAVGFVSLVTSEVYPIKYFGLFTAFGVLSAMLLSLVLIPAGLVIFGLPRWKNRKPLPITETDRSFGSRFAERVVRHKRSVLLLTVVTMAIALFGISRVWIDSSFLEKFERDSEIVRADSFINRHFGGTSSLNVILDGQTADTFKQPALLSLIDRLQSEVELLPVVGNSFAVTDYLRRMHMVMHADNPEFNAIPDTSDMIAQYLLLYEVSGDPENLLKVVDYSYRKANLRFQIKSDSSAAINEVLAILERYKPLFASHAVTVNYAGSGYKGLVFADLILEGQISSLVISLVLIIGLLTLMFRSLRLGLIGAVPIVITAFISFGTMGLLDIPLSTTTALISSIAVGIGIDFAVHFIERYRIYALATGSVAQTMQKTMQHSGRAIAFNALVVIAGFMVLLASVFPPNRALGALVSLNMFTSFLGTVTVMLLLLPYANIGFRPKQTLTP